MTAPKGNKNRMTHGVYGYLAIGSLPKGASYVRRLLGQFRSALESSVQDMQGEIGIHSAALIQSACRHEARAQLLTRWLRTADGELSLTDKLAVLREIGKATDSRDACLQRLGLDRLPDHDPWSTFHDASTPPESSAATDGRNIGPTDEASSDRPSEPQSIDQPAPDHASTDHPAQSGRSAGSPANHQAADRPNAG